jgi:hypothetical protein
MGQTKNDAMDMRQQEQENNQVTGTTGLSLTKKSILNMDKSQIEELAHATVSDVVDGNEDIKEVMVYVTKGLEYFTLLDKNLRPYLYEKQFEKQSLYGIKIEPAQLGTKYDYSICQDHILDDLNAKLEEAKKAVTDRQNFLKAVNVSANLVDDDTGEIYKVYAPNKTATSGYKLSWDK